MLTISSGGPNTFSGGTTVNGGTLQLNAINALGTGGLTANAGVVDLNGDNLDAAHGNVLPSLAGSGGIITDNSAAGGATNLTVNQAINTTFGGSIQTGAQGTTIALIKSGSGMLTLAGASSYAGGTTVQNGVLQLGNANALGTPPALWRPTAAPWTSAATASR